MSRFRPDAAGLALLGMGLAELSASSTGRSVVDPVGRVAVDLTPLPVVEAAIRMVGTTDKPMIRTILLLGTAGVAGLAAAGRGDAAHPASARTLGAVTGALGITAYLAGRRRLDGHRRAQDRDRRPVTVAQPLPPVTDGAEEWAHAEPLFTDVGRFYVTDVNLRPPLVDRDAWRLDLDVWDGAAAAVSFDELRALELRERDGLLVCVHNRLGWDRLGHQRWTGLPVTDVFTAAGLELPDDRDDHDLVMEATDGYRQVMPLRQVIEREAWLVLGMGGRELPAAHGFPARVMTPGVVGQYNGVKWLRRLAVVPSGSVTATWVERGWPVDTVVPPPMARIDHPGSAEMPPRLPQGAVDVTGPLTLVGTAWAPANGGVAAVEVRVGDGPWRPAQLADDLGHRSWRRWRTTLHLDPGRHDVAARCVAHDGTVQSGAPRPPFPHGVTGHHTLRVRAS